MIRVNGKLDYENITSYTLTVQAYDGVHEDYTRVIINIDNVNDNPPVFTKNITRTIVEETLIEGCVANVSDCILHFMFTLIKCLLFMRVSSSPAYTCLHTVTDTRSTYFHNSSELLERYFILFYFYLVSITG